MILCVMGKKTQVVAHLSAADLYRRYRAAMDPVERSHFHIIWLLACGKGLSECAAATGYSTRWRAKLVQRYNAEGARALGDRRQGNGGQMALLNEAQLAELAEALDGAPPGGGLWSGPKVAAWIAEKTGREHVHPQRGWDYLRRLGMSLQVPRPRHEQAASPEDQEAFKKNSTRLWRRRRPKTPKLRWKSGPSTSIVWA